MDIELNPISDRSAPLFKRQVEKKTCPKCQSVFVTDKECEACGFQLAYNPVGEPFGERSFFNLKEVFLHEFKGKYLLVRYGFLKDDSSFKKYKRSVLKRFEVLCDYFFNQNDGDRENRKLFLFEAQEIIKELRMFNVPKSYLWMTLEKGEDHPFFEVLAREVKDDGLAKDSFGSLLLSTIPSNLREFQSWGIILQFLVGSGAIIAAAYLVMKYLISGN